MKVALRGLLLVVMLPRLLVAADGRWTSTGPPDRGITHLLVSPAESAPLYAYAASGRFYASEDDGESWTFRSAPFPAFLGGFRAIVAHWSNPAELYAHRTGQVYRSTDGGLNWGPVTSFPTGSSISSLAVDSSDPLFFPTLYAGVTSANPTPPPLVQGSLFKTIIDIGLRWIETSLRGFGINDIAVDPSNPAIVYATPFDLTGMVASNGRGVVKSTDGGATWSAPLQQFVGMSPLTWIVIDPSHSQNVYAGTTSSHIYKSTDSGRSFQQISLGSETGTAASIAVDPQDSLQVYAAITRGGVLRSTNGGLTWTTFNCGLSQLATTGIVIGHGGLIHVGTRWGGVFSYELPAKGQAQSCPEGDPTLCLRSDGRFCVRLSWRTLDGRSGFGQAVPLTSDTGAFWFFDSSNLEIMIKVLDGTQINGRFWVFYGSLSNVEYEITVTDNETGRVKTYTNPQGHVASVTDTEAF